MREDHQFLNPNGERVFAVHHRPAQPASRAIVMCHPLGEEKLWAHRVFVTFARDMAAAGFAVLRFDFRGEGDSDRDFAQADFESRVEDACLAIDSVREFYSSVTDVTLLGLRLGASVSAMAASRRRDVSRLILWDPIVDGAEYMQTVLRLNLMYQMALHRRVVENRDTLVERLTRGETVNIEGYGLSESLFQQVASFRLPDVLRDFSGETLLVQISQDDSAPKEAFESIAAANSRCRLETVHDVPFWRETKTFCQRANSLTNITMQALGNAQ